MLSQLLTGKHRDLFVNALYDSFSEFNGQISAQYTYLPLSSSEF